MATVAEMLGGASAQSSAPGPPPPPPGFVPQAAPPPPPGFQLETSPPPRTAGQLLGMGTRGILTGVGGLVDIVAGPANATINAATGGHLSTTPGRDAATAASNAMGLQAPATDQEKFANAVVEGGTQGLVTAGLGAGVSSAEGATGIVGQSLAAHPVIDTVSSAAATGASETARQHGAGPLGQLAAGFAAGAAGVGGAKRVADVFAGITERYGPKAAKLVTEVPREAVIDPKGNLTDEGKDVAAHNDLHPDQLKGAYDDAAAATNDNVAPVAEAAPAEAAPAPAEAVSAPETAPAPQAPPEAAPEALPANANEPLPATAQDRVTQAQSEGIGLTRGQATQDFDAQAQEDLLKGSNGPEGAAARTFFANQQQQIANAVDRFKQGFGNPDATPEERGQLVKDAVTQLRDSGKAGVSALYEQAQQLAESAAGGAGSAGSNLVNLDTAPLLARIKQILIDEGVDPKVRNALRQQAAQYGLMGQGQRVFEDGSATVRLAGQDGEPGPSIQLQRPQEPLSIVNAEKFRQFVNSQFQDDKTAALQSLKPILDNAVQSAVERAASEGTGEVGKAFQAARAANVKQQQTFNAKDVVQQLIDWKVRGVTPTVKPEDVIRKVLGTDAASVTDLKKVKAVLLSKPTAQSKAAWQAIQAHAVAKIFDKAMVINANAGGGSLGAISGAKLNTEIAKFGLGKLKVLLPEEDFNQLMKLRRIVGDATIPIARTTNPSGSGYAVIRFLAKQGMNLVGSAAGHIPVVGSLAHGASYFMQMGKEAAAAKKTLEGIESFTKDAAVKADQPKPEAADYAKRFISVAGSDQIMAPLIASAANEQRH